jgi:hypothetical protein
MFEDAFAPEVVEGGEVVVFVFEQVVQQPIFLLNVQLFAYGPELIKVDLFRLFLHQIFVFPDAVYQELLFLNHAQVPPLNLALVQNTSQ